MSISRTMVDFDATVQYLGGRCMWSQEESEFFCGIQCVLVV